MAIIVPSGGPIVGRVGGVVYQGGKYGMVVRRYMRPALAAKLRNSPGLLRLGVMPILWSQLQASDRQSWVDYALVHPVTGRLRQTIHLSGIQWFTKFNTMRLAAGVAIAPTAPAVDYAVVWSTLPALYCVNDVGGWRAQIYGIASITPTPTSVVCYYRTGALRRPGVVVALKSTALLGTYGCDWTNMQVDATPAADLRYGDGWHLRSIPGFVALLVGDTYQRTGYVACPVIFQT